ncbi:MAG: preprotein translocase subunit SecG [Patescibacteria group bacterium]
MFLILQAIVAILLITLILLQERSSGLSGIVGGSESSSYQTRRGLEKFIFYGTIVLAVIFIGLALLKLIF